MDLFYCGNQWGYTPLGKVLNIPAGYCDPPFGLSVVVQNQYAYFSWKAPHDYESFELLYRDMPAASGWTHVIVHGTSIRLALQPFMDYEWKVRTVCSSADSRYSEYANGPAFTTGRQIEGCESVGTVGVTHMSTFFRLSWFDTGAIYYKVFICPNTSNCPFFVSTQNAYYDAMNLQEGTLYQARVVAVCTDGTEAPSSPWVPFKATSFSCYPPLNLATIASPTTIMASWLPNPANHPGAKYNVYLDGDLVAVNIPFTNFTITDLMPLTRYSIDVRTNCQDSFSDPVSIAVSTLTQPCSCTILFTLGGATATTQALEFDVDECLDGSVAQDFQLVVNTSTRITIALTETTYTLDSLATGAQYYVEMRVRCVGGLLGPAKAYNFTLNGCGKVEGLEATNSDTGTDIAISWMPLSGVDHYNIEIAEDGVYGPASMMFDTLYVISNARIGVVYTARVTPVCWVTAVLTLGIPDEVSSSFDGSTIDCVAYEIVAVERASSTMVKVTVSVATATGPVTGHGRVVVVDAVTNATVGSAQFFASGPVYIGGLAPGNTYLIYAYDIPVNPVPADPADDGCMKAAAYTYVHSDCWQLTPANITLAQPSENILQVGITGAAWTTAQTDAMLSYAYEGGDYSDPIPVTVAGFPYNIAVAGYARYKVRITPICAGVEMATVEFKYSCPEIADLTIQVNGTTLTGTFGRVLLGTYRYVITLMALGHPTVSAAADNNSTFSVGGLVAGVIYSGEAKLVCNETPVTYSNILSFTFSTGGGVGSVNCSLPVITSLAQDCSTTGGGGTMQCGIDERDWDLMGVFFTPMSSDPVHGIFMEATFSIPQTVAAGMEALIPGGIMGVIRNTTCLPASTVSATLEIITGALNTITAEATIAINGNITGSGSYMSDGGTTLLVRVRASYLKA